MILKSWYRRRVVFACCALLFLLLNLPCLTAQDEVKKVRARISLEYLSSNVLGNQLKATVKAKLERSYEGIPDIKLDFYQGEVIENNLIGSAITDSKGVAVMSADRNSNLERRSGPQLYVVSLENDPKFRDASGELEVTPAAIMVDAIEEDSLRLLSISVSTSDTSDIRVPVADMPVKIYVKRMFGLLQISEGIEATDEEGLLEFEFPQDIPGDKDGIITVEVKIEEDEVYGSLVYELKPNWGVPLLVDQRLQKRELWSSRANAPIYLIVLVNGIILAIWTVIADVIRQVFRIKKFGNKS